MRECDPTERSDYRVGTETQQIWALASWRPVADVLTTDQANLSLLPFITVTVAHSQITQVRWRRGRQWSSLVVVAKLGQIKFHASCALLCYSRLTGLSTANLVALNWIPLLTKIMSTSSDPIRPCPFTLLLPSIWFHPIASNFTLLSYVRRDSNGICHIHIWAYINCAPAYRCFHSRYIFFDETPSPPPSLPFPFVWILNSNTVHRNSTLPHGIQCYPLTRY